MPELSDVNQQFSDRLFNLHAAIAFTILGLVGFHVMGALRHHFMKKDNVLKSMIDGSPRL
jgi:cytochrome b561